MNDVANVPRLQILVHLRLGKGGVAPKEQVHPFALVTFDYRLKDFLTAVDAVDVPRQQQATLASPRSG